MGDGAGLSAGGAPPGSVETVSWNRRAISPLTPPRTVSENPCSPSNMPFYQLCPLCEGARLPGVAPRLRVHWVRRSVPPVCTSLQAWLWTRGELRMGTRTAEPLGVVQERGSARLGTRVPTVPRDHREPQPGAG